MYDLPNELITTYYYTNYDNENQSLILHYTVVVSIINIINILIIIIIIIDIMAVVVSIITLEKYRKEKFY